MVPMEEILMEKLDTEIMCAICGNPAGQEESLCGDCLASLPEGESWSLIEEV